VRASVDLTQVKGYRIKWTLAGKNSMILASGNDLEESISIDGAEYSYFTTLEEEKDLLFSYKLYSNYYDTYANWIKCEIL
jgi:hypothetical protein